MKTIGMVLTMMIDMGQCKNCGHGCHCSNGSSCSSCGCHNCEHEKKETPLSDNWKNI